MSQNHSIIITQFRHTHTETSTCMEGSWPENLDTIRNRMIEELMKGLELAILLPSVVNKLSDGSGSAKDLASKIIISLSNTLSILNVKDQVSVISQIHLGDSPCLDAQKSEDYSQERGTPTTKMGRTR